ncbi:SlyX family protein [Paremcibacter congregatus]|uniref:Protein SlyX homolog n=1 Tax=Paremcibacter congregatus TaxID=2043170 RepID=A0A2G4YQF1_9PROT|nr:SlyX family protein [Paremcibacter congregatus]PHZ84500.1 hypothetical protein CRD36_11890 [Paremcibacter congregatus]QDE28719.1 SlyX family protein [Paremcibacter congregatus]|tara:strand:- start:168 stop:383 length:216 start_codon:yes stop_codon:yes gene_type:complete
MTSDETRLQNIEQTLAHQDQHIQDLSDMVNQQWQEIDRLKKSLSRTEARLGNLETPEEESGDITHEVPPHY